MTREDKARLEEVRARRAELEAEVAELRRMLEEQPDHPQRHLIEVDIAHDLRILEMIRIT